MLWSLNRFYAQIKRMKNYTSIVIGCLLILVSCKESTQQSSLNETEGIYNPNDFPIVELSIKENRLKELDSIRLNALLLNDFSNTRKWFKAKINLKTGRNKAKIRLKGDLQDHYDTERFSFRLKYTHNKIKTVLSLQHPKTRKYICEWIFHQLLKQEVMNYLTYDFVTVVINNKVKGLYASEEHLTNYGVIEKWNRPPGPILGFDDSGFWAGGLDTVIRDSEYDTKSYLEAKIRVYNYEETDSLSLLAINLLDGYRKNNLPSDSVFDMEILGKFYALCDLNGATHGLRWLNCRYYYNCDTKRLEPIGFDSNSGELEELVYYTDYLNEAHHARIKSNDKFIGYYTNALKYYRKKTFLDQFFEANKKPLDLYINAIFKTDSINCNDYLNYYYHNQELMVMP